MKTDIQDREDERIVIKMASDIEYIQRDVKDIKLTLRGDYITRAEFEPVKKVIYGLVGLILVAVVSAIVALVII